MLCMKCWSQVVYLHLLSLRIFAAIELMCEGEASGLLSHVKEEAGELLGSGISDASPSVQSASSNAVTRHLGARARERIIQPNEIPDDSCACRYSSSTCRV